VEQCNCYFCDSPCTEDDFCAGCSQYVCFKCDKNPDTPYGRHSPSTHSGSAYYAEDLNEEYSEFDAY